MNGWSAVGEELAFRLLLLGGLAAWWHSDWLAWIAVTVLFGLHHYPVGGLRAARLHLGTGAVFGALMLLGGGIWAAICAHLVYNVLAAIAREADMQSRPRPARRLGLRRIPYPH